MESYIKIQEGFYWLIVRSSTRKDDSRNIKV